MKDYPAEFFDMHGAGAQRSAEVIIPAFLQRYPETTTVVDVGCGQGFFGAQFAEHGRNVLGIDGPYVRDALIPMLAWDLEIPLPARVLRADVVVCLEVAEHLPESRSDSLVAELCEIAPITLWSAAIPGQGGNHHVNCQWPSYWAERFLRHGRYLDDSIRTELWDDERLEPWYRQNLMVAGPEPCDPPRDLRHPAC